MRISTSILQLSCEAGVHPAAMYQWKHQGLCASVPAFRDIVTGASPMAPFGFPDSGAWPGTGSCASAAIGAADSPGLKRQSEIGVEHTRVAA